MKVTFPALVSIKGESITGFPADADIDRLMPVLQREGFVQTAVPGQSNLMIFAKAEESRPFSTLLIFAEEGRLSFSRSDGATANSFADVFCGQDDDTSQLRLDIPNR